MAVDHVYECHIHRICPPSPLPLSSRPAGARRPLNVMRLESALPTLGSVAGAGRCNAGLVARARERGGGQRVVLGVHLPVAAGESGNPSKRVHGTSWCCTRLAVQSWYNESVKLASLTSKGPGWRWGHWFLLSDFLCDVTVHVVCPFRPPVLVCVAKLVLRRPKHFSTMLLLAKHRMHAFALHHAACCPLLNTLLF